MSTGRSAAVGTDLDAPAIRVGRSAARKLGARPEHEGTPRWSSRLLVALAIAVAIAVHVWLLGRSTVDADEAVIGLMAHAILRGHFTAFYWGQHYGGNEAYVTAALFLVFGSSAFALKLTASLLAACCAVLTWRIGRRLCSPLVGACAGLLFALWPEVDDYASIKEFGFRWTALTCGLVTILMVIRLRDGDRRRATWAVLGLALGIGWWSTPEILYQAVPALIVLGSGLARRRVALRPSAVALGLGGLVIGALPWLWSNLGDGFASLDRTGRSDYGAFLGGLFTHALPLALGLRLRSSPDWVLPADLGIALYVLMLVGLATEVTSLVRHRRGGVLVVALATFPFLYAALPVGYWFDGRFTLALGPVLAIVFADGAVAAARSIGARIGASSASRPPAAKARPWRGAELIGACLLVAVGWGITAAAMARVAPEHPSSLALTDRTTWTAWHADPNNLIDSAIALMHAHGVRDAYAGYWVAYPITELSGETILVSDAPAPVRSAAIADAIASSSRPAWVFVTAAAFPAASEELRQDILNPGCTKVAYVCLNAVAFEHKLTAAHIGYAVWHNAAFVIVEPDRNLSPRWVLARTNAAG